MKTTIKYKIKQNKTKTWNGQTAFTNLQNHTPNLCLVFINLIIFCLFVCFALFFPPAATMLGPLCLCHTGGSRLIRTNKVNFKLSVQNNKAEIGGEVWF